MTERIIRTNRASARTATAEPPAPRRAQRTTLPPPSVRGTRTTTTSTHQGRVTVSENVQSEQVGSPQHFTEEPERVGVSLGKTINMGNFESLRIDVQVSMPCAHNQRQAAFDNVLDFALEKLISTEEEMMGAAAPQPQRGRTANRRG